MAHRDFQAEQMQQLVSELTSSPLQAALALCHVIENSERARRRFAAEVERVDGALCSPPIRRCPLHAGAR